MICEKKEEKKKKKKGNKKKEKLKKKISPKNLGTLERSTPREAEGTLFRSCDGQAC